MVRFSRYAPLKTCAFLKYWHTMLWGIGVLSRHEEIPTCDDIGVISCRPSTHPSLSGSRFKSYTALSDKPHTRTPTLHSGQSSVQAKKDLVKRMIVACDPASKECLYLVRTLLVCVCV